MRTTIKLVMVHLFGVLTLQASAVTFYLDAREDLPDANPGDGVAITEMGTTTLRAAIEEANALPGADEIVFTYGASSKTSNGNRAFRAGHAYVEAPLIVSDNLIVREGDFPSSLFEPRGPDQFRVLEVLSAAHLELRGIEIEELLPIAENMYADRGAAIYIHPGAKVTLSGCTVRFGIATIAGGGIYVDRGTLELRGGTVSGHSQGSGGGVYNDGGVVYARGAWLEGTADEHGGALLNDHGVVRVSGAQSGYLYLANATAGGGIYSWGGSIVMDSVSILGNEAPLGGAIYLAGGASFDLFGCSFAENAAEIDGAGIYLESGTLRAALCTFGSGLAGGSGGGVYVAGGSATFLNCTFTENTAVTGGGGAGGGLAVDVAGGATCVIGNTIVAGNVAQAGQPGTDISGTIVSLGHNLIGVADGAVGFTGTDLAGSLASPLPPLLKYTFNHDGTPESPRRIYIPQPGSPAIDAGDNALLSHADFVGGSCFDARLTCCPRVRGAAVDIGAIEVQEGEIGLTCTGTHSADYDTDSRFSLSELLRAIQLYNSEEFHCASFAEDGYDVGPGDQTCAPHSSDYAPQDWRIGIIELMRVIQFYNLGGYHPCEGSEEGFCPGAG